MNDAREVLLHTLERVRAGEVRQSKHLLAELAGTARRAPTWNAAVHARALRRVLDLAGGSLGAWFRAKPRSQVEVELLLLSALTHEARDGEFVAEL